MNDLAKKDDDNSTSTISRNGTTPRTTLNTNSTMHFVDLMDPPTKDPDLTTKSGGQSKADLKLSRLQSNASFAGGHFPLYEEDTSSNMLPLSVYLTSLAGIDTSSGHVGAHGKKGAKLGMLFGVYLPSIQHILGVQMFLRLVWIVGVAGFVESFSMIFICCLCTLLTSISISAIATNGVIDSGGAYFMISRNLGPEFGGAIGILYYLANTVATAMYLVGGVEILLMYMAPGLPQFASPEPHEPNFNNFRIYGTVFLIILFGICTLGIRFVQFFAPVSLAMVLLSIFSVFVGGFVASPNDGPNVCLLGKVMLLPESYTDLNGTAYCNKSVDSPLWKAYCHETDDNLSSVTCDPYFEENSVRLVPGIPGFSSGVISENLWSSYMESGQSMPGRKGKHHAEVSQDISTTFFVLLAIFFPSVTGIMTGANMSGDLKDPQKSIPVGTIAATLTTSFIYLALVVTYAGTTIGPLLRDKYGESIENTMVVAVLAWPDKWLLLVGSFTACVGAGLQCLCTSPRLLQSVAKDNLVPFLSPFSAMTKGNEPFKALLLTVAIAECAILIGGIDYIAPVVDFFFLTSYCFVNLACALQTLLKAPNWRPRFKFYHWSLAVLGALLNLFIMFSTFWYYAVVVLVLCAALYKYIEFKGAKKEWGDGMRGLALSTAQYSLLRVEEAIKQHPKNWRPQLLLLLKLTEAEEAQNRKMLHLANQLKAGRGLTMVASLLQGDLSNPEDRERALNAKMKLQAAMQEAKLKGFTEVALTENLSDNVGTLIQCVGMGGLRPNTVLVGWPQNWRKTFYDDSAHSSILDTVHRATAADLCLLVAKGLPMFPDARDQLVGYIDVWWIIHDGGLLILLPFLLRQHKVWRQCSLRIFAVAQFHDNTIKMKEDLQRWVYQLRIEAEVHVVELSDSIVAPYTYERTIMMEERARLAMNLHLTDEELNHEPQLLADRYRHESTAELFHRASMRGGSRKKANAPPLPLIMPSTADSVEGDSSTTTSPGADGGGAENRAFKNDAGGGAAAAADINRRSSSRDDDSDGDALDDDAFFGDGVAANKTASVKADRSASNKGAIFRISDDSEPDSTLAERLRIRRQNKQLLTNVKKSSILSGEVDTERLARLDKKKVRKMNMAIRLNKAIHSKSSTSRLVILNLPKPPRAKEAMDQYMEYLEVLTENLERVLLVRGSGKEVITIYS